MTRWKRDWRIERHADQNFLAGHRAFAMGCLVGSGMDAVHDGVRRREAGIHKRDAETQAAIEAITRGIVNLDVPG
jgi:hypothetical protein